MITKNYIVQKNMISEILKDIRKFLIQLKIDQKNIAEYEFLSEELLIKILETSIPDEELSVCFKKQRNSSNIIISYKGTPINLDDGKNDFGSNIIRDYSERISQKRKYGTNYITLSLETVSANITKKLQIAVLLAALTGTILCLALNSDQITWLTSQILHPTVMLFIKLLQNLAVPIAFFSLLTNIVNSRASFEFDSQLKQIAVKYMVTSVLATVIPFSLLTLAGAKITGDSTGHVGGLSLQANDTIYMLGSSAEEVLNNLLPDNLLEIFTLSNPLPMLFIALILGAAINSYSGKKNEKIREGINIISDFLSKVVSLIFSMLPFFCYFSIVGLVIWQFSIHELSKTFVNIVLVGAAIFLMFIAQFIVYIFQLKLSGISVSVFFRKYKDILLENFRICSNVNALPYNIRMFRHKINDASKEKFVESALNLGANVNMDGNCLIITTVMSIFCLSLNYEMSTLFLIETMAIILLLGIGSPNQPGSFTIAMLVLIKYLNFSDKLFFIIIIYEAMFFRLYSVVNAFGDIVTVTIAADDELKAQEVQNGTF